ncbi:MAG: hypothetical protein KDI09_18695, partial [Halioglobus sp.]|nr:hypothetical protein [Halioglobus sp.]
MKRRDFLIRSAAGALLPLLGRAQTAPCPPAGLDAGEGSVGQPVCGLNAGDAEADWIARSTAPGVVWCHDFRSAAEVNAFRWSVGYRGGNDPNNVQRPGVVNHITNDGITGGGCIELYRTAGSFSEGTHWIRPFAPMTAPGNGRNVDDPAAGGTIPVRNWSSTDGGSQTSDFTNGWYGHSSYKDADPEHFDGTEFWLQYRAKRDPRRVSGGNQNFLVGKHIYLAMCEGGIGAPNQELVVYSNGGGSSGASAAGQNSFRIYGGAAYFTALDEAPGAGGTIQPGGASPVWQWASGSWDTIMYHLIMGRQGVNETRIEVYG